MACLCAWRCWRWCSAQCESHKPHGRRHDSRRNELAILDSRAVVDRLHGACCDGDANQRRTVPRASQPHPRRQRRPNPRQSPAPRRRASTAKPSTHSMWPPAWPRRQLWQHARSAHRRRVGHHAGRVVFRAGESGRISTPSGCRSAGRRMRWTKRLTRSIRRFLRVSTGRWTTPPSAS